MNVDYINPFLVTIINILSTMAQTEAKPGKPSVKEGSSAFGDVTGVIGLTGENVKGSFSITFTESSILSIASKMLGEKMDTLDGQIVDVVGEITNMVSGGARKLLAEQGNKFEMALPSTIMGKNHTIVHSAKNAVIVLPFETEDGDFFVEICLDS